MGIIVFYRFFCSKLNDDGPMAIEAGSSHQLLVHPLHDSRLCLSFSPLKPAKNRAHGMALLHLDSFHQFGPYLLPTLPAFPLIAISQRSS